MLRSEGVEYALVCSESLAGASVDGHQQWRLKPPSCGRRCHSTSARFGSPTEAVSSAKRKAGALYRVVELAGKFIPIQGQGKGAAQLAELWMVICHLAIAALP